MLGDNPQWAQIECGALHTAAITKKGEVFTWGWNENGLLGHGEQKSRFYPTKVAALEGFVVTQVSCSFSHMAALTANGELFMWYES